MKQKILHYLKQLEEEKDITILLAVETGSRAWGFPSPDSDFDVRLIYVHKQDWYLSLNEKKDSIEVMFEDNEIDISGWELRKSLRLLGKSNASLLERIQSSIIYHMDEDFLKGITNIAEDQYSRIGTIHHYLSMTKKFIFEMEQEKEYKLKKFFYALRSATACKWILERDEIPPISFHKMLNGLNLDKSLLVQIHKLIELKSTISERYMHQGEEELFNYIKQSIKQAEEKKSSLPASGGKVDLDHVNQFFINIIRDNDY